MRAIRSASLAIGITALLGFAAPAAARDTMIVYDASNSMWGQIGGEAKVSIARRVMADLIENWDASTDIGLVAYGHRHKSDCSDIETVAPVGPIDRGALIEQLENIQPKGRTPLTAAVRHAAEALSFRDSPATVVLVSDGIESCNADPCAASRELAQAGIRFTAHVVGFDVAEEADQAQLRCIAENTGGRFFAAGDAQGLKAALNEVAQIAAEPEPKEATVTLTAPESAVAGSEVAVGWEGEGIQSQDMIVIVTAEAEPHRQERHKRISDDSHAALQTPGTPGPHEIRYLSTATGRVAASKPILLTEPQTTLSAPAEAVTGAEISVFWENAVHPQDYVTIVPVDAPAAETDNHIRVGGHSEGKLITPSKPGSYEVRYLLGVDRQVLARSPVEVVPANPSVSAPLEATIGSEVGISWQNPVHPGDYITIVPADAPDNTVEDHIRVGDDAEGALTAPAEPGAYEVRYVLGKDRKLMDRAALQLVPANASVTAPAEATIGSTIKVSWENPVHRADYVTIVPADAPDNTVEDHIRVRDEAEGFLVAPPEPGAYEVRYVLGKGRMLLDRAALQLVPARSTVEAPPEATVGSKIPVRWRNPVHPADYITIVMADAPENEVGQHIRVRDNAEDNLKAPDEPGTYEVRYVLGKGKKLISRVPIVINTD